MEEFVIENMMETVLLGSGKKWYTFPFKWNSGELWVDHSILFCYFGVGKHSKDPLKCVSSKQEVFVERNVKREGKTT